MATTADIIDHLRTQVRGDVLEEGNDAYEEARTVWNGAVDRHPVAIARCIGPEDVAAAITFARERDLPFSVKSGGHMTTGHAIVDAGIVLDLSSMDEVRVDPTGPTVRVGGGATWDQVNEATLAEGLVAPGIPDSVGVGGFTVGGGMGVVMRKHGLAADNLREAEVVTADGRIVTASADENEDLFWALRGGGGNVGVVTSFEFDCFVEPRECLTAQCMYRLEDAEGVLQHVRESMADLPDAVFPLAAFITLPDLPDFPAEVRGEPGLFLMAMGVGEPDELADPVEAFASYGDPLLRVVEPTDFTALYDPFKVPKGERHHWESVYLANLSDEVIDVLIEDGTPFPTPASGINIYCLGGAVAEVDADATAYAHRDAGYLVHVAAQWTEADDEAVARWTRALHEAVAAHGTGGEYVNNQTDTDEARVRAAYGDHYDRLAEIKARWDPENAFSSTQNVDPN